MTIVITGASGHYGRLAVEGLLKRVPAKDLILMTRQPAKLAEYAKRGLTVRQGDFDFPDTMEAAFKGADKMLLISGTRVGKRLPQHQNAIDAAGRAGVKHIHYTSFVGASADNPAVVAREHGATEEMMRASGLYWTAFRDSQYADAMLEAAAPLAIMRGEWVSATKDGTVAFITRRDCVATAVAVLSSEGHRNKIYNVTGPELLTFRDVSDLAVEITGKPIKFVDTDEDGLYAMWDSIGVPREAEDGKEAAAIPWSSNDMVSFETAIRGGWLAVISDDVERLTGQKPQSLRSFFLEHADQLRAAKAG